MKLTRVRIVRLAVILGLVAVTVLGWFFVLSPRLSEVDTITVATNDTDLANLKLMKQQRELLDLAAQAPAKAAAAQKVFAAMPQTADLPEVLNQISQAAVRSGIKPADISVINTSIPLPITAEQAGAADAATSLGLNLATMQIDISVTGDRADLLRFLDALQSMDRAILLASNSLSRVGTTATAQESMTVTGTMFILQSELPDLVKNAATVVADATAAASSAG